METSASTTGQAQSPWAAHQAVAGDPGRPEIPVIGAFIGAFVFAKLLKKLGGGDDE